MPIIMLIEAPGVFNYRYTFMQQCWALEPEKRPTFSQLVESLSCSLEGMAGYVHIGAFGIIADDTHDSWFFCRQEWTDVSLLLKRIRLFLHSVVLFLKYKQYMQILNIISWYLSLWLLFCSFQLTNQCNLCLVHSMGVDKLKGNFLHFTVIPHKTM